MNILVDARALVAKPAGIAAVIVQSIRYTVRYRKDIHFRLLTPAEIHPELQRLLPKENVEVEVCPVKGLGKLPPLVWSNIRMPQAIRKYKPDLFWSPMPSLPYLWLSKVPCLITVYDVVHIEFRETMTWRARIGHMLTNKFAIKNADFIWTISDYTKQAVEQYYPKRECDNIFVGCSTDTDLYVRNKAVIKSDILKEFGLNDKFILFVGSLEPRKNLPYLLSLMPDLYSKGVQLLVVGGKAWKTSNISDIINAPGYPSEAVVFAKFVSNEKLAEIYNVADCFVSTSLNEGFGLPQLEALECGCPVVTSHNSAMIEVVEGLGKTVKGWNKDEWIRIILKEIENRDSFVVDSKKLQRYDWCHIIDNLISYVGNIKNK